MTFGELVKKYNGWIENGIAHFPSPYHKDAFLKACVVELKKKS